MHPKVQEYLDRVVIRNGEKWIYGDVNLSGLGLTELPFNDITVNGNFDCSYNLLETLYGSPNAVEGHFYCTDNNLTTLKGSPNTVTDCLFCLNNKLTSLEGAPQKIGGIDVRLNPLKTLKGLNDFDCSILIDKVVINCDYFLQYTLMGKIILTNIKKN